MNVSELKQLNEEISRYMQILVMLPEGMSLDPPEAENADQGEPGHERSRGPEGSTRGGGVKPGETVAQAAACVLGKLLWSAATLKRTPQTNLLSPR